MKERIIELIEEILDISNGMIKDNTLIEDVTEWDSLAHVLIIGKLEEDFGVKFTLEEAMELKSVEDIFKKVGL